ncbi:DUF4179 domain-containing protein [Paenibacillus sp. CC-CFT747]|nr:DUF4179 domain-containing protein [Paenibacillus sp. CC-CFT747]
MSRANLDARLDHLLEDKPKELPDGVRSRIELTLACLPDRRPALRPWRPWAWGTAAAAVTALAVLGSAFVSPAAAAQLRQVPGVASVFRLAGDFGLQAADEKGLVTTVDQQADDQGIELRISEALYDGTRLSIGYLQTATGQPGSWKAYGMPLTASRCPLRAANPETGWTSIRMPGSSILLRRRGCRSILR